MREWEETKAWRSSLTLDSGPFELHVAQLLKLGRWEELTGTHIELPSPPEGYAGGASHEWGMR